MFNPLLSVVSIFLFARGEFYTHLQEKHCLTAFYNTVIFCTGNHSDQKMKGYFKWKRENAINVWIL